MKIPFLKQSTIDYWREGRKSGLSFIELLHGYAYIRWPYRYIGLVHDKYPVFKYIAAPFVYLVDRFSPFDQTERNKTGDPAQERPTFADTYHGKAVPLNEAKKLVRINVPVNTAVPEQVIPYTRARDIILQENAKIVVLDCPCRTTAPNPCQPLDVCLIIGSPIADFIFEHHPDRSREIDADEAERILKQCNARGNVAHAFFKDVMLGRFYAICNCCSCCCGAMKAHRNGIEMLCSSGYLAHVDTENCIGCGECAGFCQFKAIGFRERKAYIREDRCLGCGVCTNKCPKNALSLRLAPEKGTPLEVDRIVEKNA
ncbi:4Fe-4S binding protein [Salidesulfovibrio brasiliensis]|uniref:4Fe-4S binding protein n=1 Tax=Salidesulfovibrio brasiliensis TaxID=221711 RepID=UPI0006D24711|nr:4Fe-4S binding protein [Salidesulfovibrio brasiliensis]